MKAATYSHYGSPDVLRIAELPIPSPKAGEIRIKIHASPVTIADSRLRRADPFAVRFFFGLFKPGKPVLGGVLSGTVDAVGEGVTKFKPGQAVFGATALNLGAHAQYVCLPETAPLALKPAGLSHEEAAALPFGGLTAWHFLEKANIQPGQKVLVYGASGAVGTAAVQIARHLGAEVTAVCSTANLELVKSLGAEHVVDYTRTDFAAAGPQYDVVFETVNKAPFDSCVAAVKDDGTLILGAAMLGGMLRGAWTSLTSRKKAIVGVVAETAPAVEWLAKLAEQGAFKAVIDRTYALDQIAEAHDYVDKGRKKGNVILAVA